MLNYKNTRMKWKCSRMTSCTSLVLRIVCLFVVVCISAVWFCWYYICYFISCMDFEDYPQTRRARKPNTNTKVSEGGSEWRGMDLFRKTNSSWLEHTISHVQSWRTSRMSSCDFDVFPPQIVRLERTSRTETMKVIATEKE